MNSERLGNITLDQLRAIIQEEIRSLVGEPSVPKMNDLSDFPVDDLGPWPAHLTLRREDMYGDDER